MPGDSYTVLRSECRLEVLIADRYLVLFLIFAETTRIEAISCIGSTSFLSIGRETTLGADSIEEALGVETSLDRGSPDIGAKATPE